MVVGSKLNACTKGDRSVLEGGKPRAGWLAYQGKLWVLITAGWLGLWCPPLNGIGSRKEFEK